MIELLGRYFKGDRQIWIIYGFLLIFSLLAVYSSSTILAYRYSGGNVAAQILTHAFYLFIGSGLCFLVHLCPTSLFSRFANLFLLLSIILLIATFFVGREINSATRSISLFGISIQASDIAKVALVNYLAVRLTLIKKEIHLFKEKIIPLFVTICIVCGLILPSNLSTAVLLFFVSMAILFISGVKIKHLTYLFLIAICVGGFTIGSLFILQKIGVENTLTRRATTWINRVDRFVHPDENQDSDSNLQAQEARIAVGTGGLFFGRGPGNSVQRNKLPHPYSDYIFAIMIEELGVIPSAFVIILYIWLFIRVMKMSRRTKNHYPAFLCCGMAVMIVFQAFVHMGVNVGIFPVTGQQLPLISMGGTGILMTGLSFGMILSITREIQKQPIETIITPEEGNFENANQLNEENE